MQPTGTLALIIAVLLATALSLGRLDQQWDEEGIQRGLMPGSHAFTRLEAIIPTVDRLIVEENWPLLAAHYDEPSDPVIAGALRTGTYFSSAEDAPGKRLPFPPQAHFVSASRVKGTAYLRVTVEIPPAPRPAHETSDDAMMAHRTEPFRSVFYARQTPQGYRLQAERPLISAPVAPESGSTEAAPLPDQQDPFPNPSSNGGIDDR